MELNQLGRTPRMPTFIDESGDTGHARHSLPYFRLAALWLPTLEDAEAFREAVRDLRKGLNLDQAFEFKFSRTGAFPKRRRAFLKLALHHKFGFAVCAIDKTTEYWRKAPTKEQHRVAATALAGDLHKVYLQA